MDIFFNELSVKPAINDDQAHEWLENLAKLGKLLKQIIESVDENFSFRRKENFGQQYITETQTILDFLSSNLGHSDPVYIFLLGIFDSPYITEDDPKKSDYDLMSVTLNSKDYDLTGILAAYIKDSLVVSLNNDTQWDICQLDFSVNKMHELSAKMETTEVHVKHASQKKHVIECHLPFLSKLYDWSSYKPRFDPDSKQQSVLVLVEIYSLYLGESVDTVWDEFYQNIPRLNASERVSYIFNISEKIAELHNWEKATGSLEKNNSDRKIYTIPMSDIIVSVDTQHGEFEIHKHTKGNNHLGSISFDGTKFKNAVSTRLLRL